MKGNKLILGELSEGRKNNFDFLRFLAASLVIISHSFPLSGGVSNTELFRIITKGKMTFGELAVDIFFIISGFLITQSWDRSPKLIKFMKARILRIFPGIIVAVLFSAFVLGPAFTTHKLSAYFRDPMTYNYIKSISLVKIQYFLPGVFENNIYKGAINGSIWTLMFEFGCYILVAMLGLTRMLNKKGVLALYVVSIIGCIVKYQWTNFYIMYFTLFIMYFATGAMFYVYRDKIVLNFKYMAGAIILFAIALVKLDFYFINGLLLSYIIMYIAFSPKIKLQNFSSRGDFSYGIYIYAFPLQQTVVHFFGGKMEWYINILVAYPIIVIMSFLSWRFVEKPCMQLKNKSIMKIFNEFTANLYMNKSKESRNF